MEELHDALYRFVDVDGDALAVVPVEQDAAGPNTGKGLSFYGYAATSKAPYPTSVVCIPDSELRNLVRKLVGYLDSV